MSKKKETLSSKPLRSFRIRDSRVIIDGVTYGPNPKPNVQIFGEVGFIHSINIAGQQLFPQDGRFFSDIDDMIVDENELPQPIKQ
jgi:hypothetical protein